MSLPEDLLSLLIAGVALYGLGLPLAWLLPAPQTSPWVLRTALAPLYSITAALALATLLGLVGVPLRCWQLAVVAILAWVLAWWRTRREWHVGRSPTSAIAPLAIVGASALTWVVSLAGYGLYLPNRDFKNHAFWVAQVAFNGSADPSLILRASSLSPPAQGAFYPLGLHTLLGWALPGADWNSLGVTASAAFLITAISTPLSFMALARLWRPESAALCWLAGFAAVCFPGLTGTFGFGSVTILAATALYPAALALLWTWAEQLTRALTLALLVAGLGLLVLHIAEALALAMVAALALPVLHRAKLARLGSGHWGAIVALVLLVLGVAALAVSVLGRLTTVAMLISGIARDDISPIPPVLGVLVGQPAGPAIMAPIWATLVGLGLWLAWRDRLAAFPALALAVPWALAILATATWVPGTLRLLTAPWYAQVGRITLLATPAVALLGCLALARAIERRTRGTDEAMSRPWTATAALLASAAIMLGTVSTLVPDRRRDLAASLAGAGDTPRLAKELAGRLRQGQTVLNLEGDGTANLFAAARVPVISGWALPVDQPAGAHDVGWLVQRLMVLDDPQVAAAMADLQVSHVAIGTTSMYWDTGIGYDISTLLEQPQLQVESVGTDMVILSYQADLP